MERIPLPPIKSTLSSKIALLLISSLIAFLIAELAVRVTGRINGVDFRLYMQELKNADRLPKELWISDDILNYKLKPNAQVLATTSDFSVIYKINSKGLRDKEYSYPKPWDKTRILAFGDSFTFGEGVEYGGRFTDIPEGHYPDVEIINFGVPGYGIDQELIYFATEGLKYSPDYVMIFVNLIDIDRYSTDIIKGDLVTLENIIPKNPVSDPSTLFLNRNNAVLNKKANPIILRSYLLSLLQYRISLASLKRNLEKQDREVWRDIAKTAEVKNKALEQAGRELVQKRAKDDNRKV